LNPLALWKRRPQPGGGVPRPGPLPVQRELSLDEVRVMRNDLSDADGQAVSEGATGVRPSGVRGMTAKAEVAMDRLTEKFFGPVDA